MSHECNGFYPRRRGIMEHIESGLISMLDLAVHDWLCSKANYKTGVARASARMLYDLLPRKGTGPTYRTLKRSFENLEAIGWIKRFIVRGEHGNYPIVINKFSVPELVPDGNGGMSSKRLWVNAEKTIDWKHVALEPVPDNKDAVVPELVPDVTLTCPRHDPDVTPSKEVKKLKKEKNQISKTFLPEGRTVDLPDADDSTSKSKPKDSGQGKVKGELKRKAVLTACRTVWGDYVEWFKDEEGIDESLDALETYPPAVLNYQGIQKLMDALENGKWLLADVQDAFERFLRDKYHRDFDDARIKYPVSLFAENLSAYLKPMEAEVSHAY